MGDSAWFPGVSGHVLLLPTAKPHKGSFNTFCKEIMFPSGSQMPFGAQTTSVKLLTSFGCNSCDKK